MTLDELLENFIFSGKRLRDHPSLQAAVFERRGDAAIGLTESVSGQTFPIESTITGRVFDKPWMHLFMDVGSYASYVPNVYPSVRSLVAAPIFAPEPEGKVVAVLSIGSSDRGRFKEKDLPQVQMLAHLAGVAMHPTQRLVGSRLGYMVRQIRESLGLSREIVAARLGFSATDLEMRERDMTSVDRREVLRWSAALGLYQEPRIPLVQVVEYVTPDLLRLLREDQAQLKRLTPEQFERFTADRLDRMGYEVIIPTKTNQADGGIDIIAVPKRSGPGSFLLGVQVKHHRGAQKTGRDAVDRLCSLKGGDFSAGLLVTNTQFTEDAQWMALRADNRRFARLRDIEDIKRWLEEDFTSEEEFRELPAEVELRPGLKIKIPRPGLPKSMLKSITLK